MKGVLTAIFIFLVLFSIGCSQQIIEKEKTETNIETEVFSMKLISTAFKHNQAIPPEFTCDGDDVSPPLEISDVPKNAQSLALVMDDPDAPVGTWDHWVAFNIPPGTKNIPKGTEPEGIAGKNSWPRLGYGGPCPPSGTHRYFFKLYALDVELGLDKGATKKELENEMQGHILAKAELMGTYKRQ